MSQNNDIVLGVDFGTTNSSAAVYQNSELKIFDIDPTNSSPKTLKSSIFITPEHSIFIGQTAIDEYIKRFEGIEIHTDKRLSDQEIEVVKDVEGGTIFEKIVEEYEINLPGRFILSPKRVIDRKSTRLNSSH